VLSVPTRKVHVEQYRPIIGSRGVTKRCRLSWLANSALINELNCGVREGGSCGVSANEYSGAYGAQINFGDLTPYLT
jgi:hypothetical protein